MAAPRSKNGKFSKDRKGKRNTQSLLFRRKRFCRFTVANVDEIDYKDVAKLLSSFIPAMLAAPQAPDGWHYLFGNYNLGGTVSGRLSSSNPNMQNLEEWVPV